MQLRQSGMFDIDLQLSTMLIASLTTYLVVSGTKSMAGVFGVAIGERLTLVVVVVAAVLVAISSGLLDVTIPAPYFYPVLALAAIGVHRTLAMRNGWTTTPRDKLRGCAIILFWIVLAMIMYTS